MAYNENYIMRDYDIMLKKILHFGFDIEDDRTGVGTRCLFGLSTSYDISKRVPILTKREVTWKSIVKEVLWYISGSHNINDLEEMGSKIWTPWKNKKFTDEHQFPEGSGGYIYGFNLIHYGANLNLVNDNPGAGQTGFNQLDYVINELRNNPKSRRACFTFWRPDKLDEAILPACHVFYSFIVSPDINGDLNILNCHLFQRSADWTVGVWANILIGSIFTYLIAQQVGMKPGKFYHSASHCHIYKNAIENATIYSKRDDEPNSPILEINKRNSIYEYTIDDFTLTDYNPLEKLRMPIAI